MSYTVQYTPTGSDPHNRAPSPYRPPSPYGPPSPGYAMQQQQQQQQQQPFTPPTGGQIAPGTITYTTTTSPDGKVVYHPFKAMPASYQTPQGIVSGIQWVPAEATQILPMGATPATAEFASSWNRPGADRDREWQHEEEKRRRREEKDAARREKERRKREKTEERELREARERDKRERGGISRPGSPYGNPNPGRISPYAGPGALPGVGSPYGAVAGARPISPYRAGGALPSAARPVSPYQTGGALPSGGRSVSPYHPSTTARQPSPYHSGGALPSTNRPVSPYHGGVALPGGNAYGPGYVTNQAEIERKMTDLGLGSKSSEYERRRKMSTGTGHTGGAYPSAGYSTSGGTVYSAAGAGTGPYPYSSATATSPYRSASPMPNVLQISDAGRPGSPYNPPGFAEGLPRSRGPSPSPYGPSMPGGYAQPPNVEQGMLPAPEGFSRPPNAAQSYTNFETMKIQDMDDFLNHIPRMPLVLVPHDVYHEDWIRLMTDLASAWLGRLPIPESARANGRGPKRTTVTSDLIELWNASFFLPRGVEIVFYKGRERRTGRLAGHVDTDLPGFGDRYYDDVSSTDSELSDDTDSELDDAYGPPGGGRYGHAGGVYGRQADAQAAELRDARRRRKELKEDQRRKRKEKKEKRRIRELERRYSVYLTCVNPTG